MNRTLKFRAWLYTEKKMSHKNLIEADEFGGRDCEIMQFTGLLDKNGKEIYESDLIKVSDPDFPKSYDWIGEVVWLLEDGFNGYYLQSGKNPQHRTSLGVGCFKPNVTLEVIGNVWENPELLEDKVTV